jgi:hypothetical protein
MNSNFYLEAVLDRFDQLWLTQFPDGVIKTMDESLMLLQLSPKEWPADLLERVRPYLY